MSSIICNICLAIFNIKDDSIHSTSCGHVFHENCLNQALRQSSSCPQCRQPNQLMHHQVFLTVDDEDQPMAEASGTKDNIDLAKQMKQISKKIDKLAINIAGPRTDGGFGCDREVEMYRNLVHQLQRENQDLKEILEMERILSTNTEKEMEELKMEIRERNDLINSLQNHNDSLRDEARLYEARSVRVENLLDL